MSDKPESDRDLIDEMGRAIVDRIEKFQDANYRYLSVQQMNNDTLNALVRVLEMAIASIDCRGCRKVASEAVPKRVAEGARYAFENPVSPNADQGHVH
jgi:hypothetical protein